MVKIFKCHNCHQVTEKPDDTVMVQCACGYKAEQIDSKTHKAYEKIITKQTHNIKREDVVCSACGQTGNWTNIEDGFLTCECGHEQEDM